MLAVLGLLGCTSSDATIDRDDPQPPVVNDGRVAVDLALSVSTTSGNSGATTRMAADVVQASGNFRDIQIENSMDGGAWWTTAHGVAKSWTRLNDFTFFLSFQ